MPETYFIFRAKFCLKNVDILEDVDNIPGCNKQCGNLGIRHQIHLTFQARPQLRGHRYILRSSFSAEIKESNQCLCNGYVLRRIFRAFNSTEVQKSTRELSDSPD